MSSGKFGDRENKRKDNALMKQGSEFTAKRETIKEKEQERENESHQRG